MLKPVVCDEPLLRAALVGFQTSRRVLDERIAEIERYLGTSSGKSQTATSEPAENATTRRKHKVSAEGRKRIAEAQKRRWAAKKGEATPNETPATPKRKFSAATRKRMAAAQRKRYAAKTAPKVRTAGAAE